MKEKELKRVLSSLIQNILTIAFSHMEYFPLMTIQGGRGTHVI